MLKRTLPGSLRYLIWVEYRSLLWTAFSFNNAIEERITNDKGLWADCVSGRITDPDKDNAQSHLLLEQRELIESLGNSVV